MARSVVALSLLAACGTPAAQPAPAAPAAPAAAPGDPPYAFALVYCGWEIWDGNDQLPELAKDDPSRYPGALLAIKDAVAKADLAHKAPAGSQAMVVTYSDVVKVRVAMGPIASFTPDALGSQKDYFGSKGVQVVQGIAAAIDQLEKATTVRKRLIVVSDGNDTDNEAAKAQLMELKKRAARANIALVSLIYKSPMSGDDGVMERFTKYTKVEPTIAALGADLEQAIEQAGAQNPSSR